MKILLLFGLLVFGQVALAQTPGRTKLYFLNSTRSSFNNTFLIRTTLNVPKPIRVDSRSYVLIETDADTLNFIANGQPHPIIVDSGKTYYFVASSDYTSTFSISETSERMFWLTASINETRQTKSYFFDKNGTVQEQ